jgi:hypothetical protein
MEREREMGGEIERERERGSVECDVDVRDDSCVVCLARHADQCPCRGLTGGPRSIETATPQDPTVGMYLETYRVAGNRGRFL